MAHQFGLSDSSVVVVIGSGAGGGTLSNELAQKGIDVVCLEAGSRLTLADVVNDPPVMDQRMGWHDIDGLAVHAGGTAALLRQGGGQDGSIRHTRYSSFCRDE